MYKKGIILAGGSGTRLHPTTIPVCKQLLPIYDKPMIYYPLATLMLGGIRDILIISTPKDISKFEELFGNGSHLGINIEYTVQKEPKGIAQAFIIGKDFIRNSGVSLILGDNIFHGNLDFYRKSLLIETGACIFAYKVEDPERYGIVELRKSGLVISIEEKPKIPKSKYAVTGLYVYDNQIVDIAKNLKPSDRGELEITDINNEYLKRNELYAKILGRGMNWMDTGTHDSLLDASNYIASIQKRQGLKIACLEEIAYNSNFIDAEQMLRNIHNLPNTEYKKYLENIL